MIKTITAGRYSLLSDPQFTAQKQNVILNCNTVNGQIVIELPRIASLGNFATFTLTINDTGNFAGINNITIVSDPFDAIITGSGSGFAGIIQKKAQQQQQQQAALGGGSGGIIYGGVNTNVSGTTIVVTILDLASGVWNIAGTVVSGGLSTISTDATFAGNGTSGSPLKLPYKTYVASISLDMSNNPFAVVLENTLGGTIIWSRISTGVYNGVLTGAFSPGNGARVVMWTQNTNSGNTTVTATALKIEFYVLNSNTVQIVTLNLNPNVPSTFSTPSDSILINTGVVINVYPNIG
jgi:hypothetical protein